MTPLRSILVHIDASPRCAVRLALARDLAQRHSATLTALYAVTPGFIDMPYAYAEATAGMIAAMQELDSERRDAARKLFDQANTGQLLHWRDLATSTVADSVADQALYADLLVLGQRDGDGARATGVPADFVATALIASGKPALVVPSVGPFSHVGNEVLIAWKATRESARAVASAVPMLQLAQRVHISCANEPEAPSTAFTDLQAYLRQHSVHCPIEQHGPLPDDIPGEALLSLAADVSADLLVMGCYGHSRLRELMLGGVSRTILQAMTLPVWMTH